MIFTIPAVFASMIHDSYKNFLPDSVFTKTIDYFLFSQWQLSLVLYSFFGVQSSTVQTRYNDHLFAVGMEVVFVTES